MNQTRISSVWSVNDVTKQNLYIILIMYMYFLRSRNCCIFYSRQISLKVSRSRFDIRYIIVVKGNTIDCVMDQSKCVHFYYLNISHAFLTSSLP